MFHRDGFKKSLWQNHSEIFELAPVKKILQHYDVIIAGVGITGINLGLQLQKSGKQVLILEAKNLCFGTTGGTTAHINTLLDTPYNVIRKNFGDKNAATVAQAAKDAVDLIRKNISEYKID